MSDNLTTGQKGKEMSDNSGRNSTIKWIILLCVSATIAIVGWTTVANLGARLITLDEIKQTAVTIQAAQQANNVRISVLENKYDSIMAQLAEIKVMLQKLRDKE
jgi:hypothetical protein